MTKATEVIDEMATDTEEEASVSDDEALVLDAYSPRHVDITPHRLAARVYSFGKGDYAVTDIDAKGIKTIAIRLGISVTDSKFKETSDGKGYYFTAKAINLTTGQKATDPVFQSKCMLHGKKKGQFDEDAMAKGATRVVRRVRRQLIPEEIIDQAVEYALIGKNTPDAVGTAKTEATEARDRNKLALKAMGITAKQCYEDAQHQMGPAENWGAAEWYALRDKYLDPEVEFAHLVPETKSQPDPAQPVIDDRTKAINDVVVFTNEFKIEHPNLIPVIFNADGKIKTKLITHWFRKDAKDLDVGECGELIELLKKVGSGDYILLPPELQPVDIDSDGRSVASPLTPQDLNTAVNMVVKTPAFIENAVNPHQILEVIMDVFKVSDISELGQEVLAEVIDNLKAENAYAIYQSLKESTIHF